MDELPRVALVTGAAKRLGHELALTLASLGFDIALHCRSSRDEAIATRNEIESLGQRGSILVTDFEADSFNPGTMISKARAELGPLGILVNSAASFHHDRLANLDRDRARRQLDVNLLTPVMLAQAFAAQLPADAKGLIVNLTDARLDDPTPHYLSYTISKAGLWAATQVLARDLAPRIRVNAIAPGPTLPWPQGTMAAFEALTAKLPLGHGPSTKEIGHALAFLVQCPSITGQAIFIDGGQHMRRHVE